MSYPDPTFMEESHALESAYLESEDEIRQSGFSGGRERWVTERSPLVDAIDADGDFLDVGCANGLLAADVLVWARRRGLTVTPYGIDLGPTLVELAQNRLSRFRDNFVAANAWTWEPARQWTYVYSLLDLSPPVLWCDWLLRLRTWVKPGGRLIIGSYGSQSKGLQPEQVSAVIENCGLAATGSSSGGNPVTTRFAWTEVE